MITSITPITAIRDMIIIINGETEMIEMRIDDVKTPKIMRILPILFMVIWVGADVFSMVGTIAEKAAYDKAMARSVEINAVCEEVYNSADA